MYKLVFCFLLAIVAVASAVYLPYNTAYVASGAYGSHGPFAASFRARVDAPRHDIALTTVSHDYVHHYDYGYDHFF